MNKAIFLVLVIILLISGCASQTAPPASPPVAPQAPAPAPAPAVKEISGLLKGVSLSPRSPSADHFTGFFEEAVEAGDMVMWAGDWNELQVDKGAPTVVTELASTYGYIPLIEVTFHADGKLVRPLNEGNRKKYKDNTVAFAEKYKPRYLGLGIEVNNVYLESPADFEGFVLFYNDVYQAVKNVSPDTKVFTVFQLERMKGLTLWEIEEVESHWELIDRFKSDIVAFTTYPGLFYRNPSDIPEDHYTEIKAHATKPVAFTEIGWHSEASPQGWEGSEQEQAEFIEKFFQLSKDIDLKIAIWSFLYDPETMEPFRSMGLRNNDGTVKPAWDSWINR